MIIAGILGYLAFGAAFFAYNVYDSRRKAEKGEAIGSAYIGLVRDEPWLTAAVTVALWPMVFALGIIGGKSDA